MGGLSSAQARRALAGHRRVLRSDLGMQIGELEDQLRPLIEGWLPVRRPRPQTAEADLADLLRDERRRVLRVWGLPVLHRDGGADLDELVDELRRLYDVRGGRPELLVQRLSGQLCEIKQLRGRGGRYGAIRRGVALKTLVSLGEDHVNQWLAMGGLESTARELHQQLAAALDRPDEDGYVGVLRALYFWLADRGAADQTFAEVFADLPLIGVVMADPRRPRWCSWQRLAADYLGIRRNRVAAGLEYPL